MRIEDLINFSQLSFVDGKRATYQFAPVKNLTIWQELLEGSLDLPQTCSICPQGSQIFLWRTFTDQSLKSFINNQGRGKTLDLERCDTADEKGRLVYIKETKELEEPGYLWVARSVNLAMAVGLSRAILSNEPVSLLGINICRCDLETGYNLYTTIPSHGKTYIWLIDSTDLERVDKHNFFKEEELVTEIPQHKIESGVAYQIDSTFFDYVKRALEGTSSSENNLRRLADFLDIVLIDLARHDLNLKNILAHHLDVNVLARTWRPFLSRIPNATFY